ncbi:MAG TPA: twin transmembrane helix small protein [Rhizomicrobium sp.]|nr:twin transmembrane helix small protein [Rhizomicrobium sp.]
MSIGGGIVVGIALAAVVVILTAGLSTLFIGGEVQKHWSNRLMRYRVLAQAVAVLIVLAVLYLARGQ